MERDFEHRYRAVRSRDERFDGWFFVAVTATGIYCRPSCPVVTPKRLKERVAPTSPPEIAQLHAALPGVVGARH